VIYCVNLKSLDADMAGRLRTYVEQGGNLVWICGDNVEVGEYNRMNEQAGGTLLPAPLLEVRSVEAGSGKDSWNCTFLEKKHPALSALMEPPELYQSILLYKHVRIDKAPALSVMARLDDGEPFLVERNVADGKVVMLCTSGHVGWTNLPLRPIFLPLLARMTFQLAGAEQARHVGVAGTPLKFTFDAKNQPNVLEIQPPSGVTNRFQMVDEKGARLKEYNYPETHDIGIYMVNMLGGARNVQMAYSVNVDPDESSAAKITPDEMKQAFGKTPLIFADNPEDLRSVFKLLREGRSLWGLFLTLVLVGLVAETFISNYFTPKPTEDDTKGIAPGLRRLAKKGRAA
jgi:hypothetical protein